MNDASVIQLWQRPPDVCIGAHEHACHECYERKLCVDVCAREPDQEEDGVQAGAITRCDDCRKGAPSDG